MSRAKLLIAWLANPLAICAQSTAPSGSVWESVSIEEVADSGAEVWLGFDRAPQYRYFSIPGDRPRVVVDLIGTRHGLPSWRHPDLLGGPVTGIRSSQFSPAPKMKSRLVIDLVEMTEYQVRREVGAIVVHVGAPLQGEVKPGPGEFKGRNSPAKNPVQAEAPSPSAEGLPAPAIDAQERARRVAEVLNTDSPQEEPAAVTRATQARPSPGPAPPPARARAHAGHPEMGASDEPASDYWAHLRGVSPEILAEALNWLGLSNSVPESPGKRGLIDQNVVASGSHAFEVQMRSLLEPDPDS